MEDYKQVNKYKHEINRRASPSVISVYQPTAIELVLRLWHTNVRLCCSFVDYADTSILELCTRMINESITAEYTLLFTTECTPVYCLFVEISHSKHTHLMSQLHVSTVTIRLFIIIYNFLFVYRL